MSSYIADVGNSLQYDSTEPIYKTVHQQFERIIVESLITAFGLDFIVKDQHGGDVDTIHNVRQIENDPLMVYKNAQNHKDYDNRGKYDDVEYHKDKRYRDVVHAAREKFDKDGIMQDDAYVPGNKVIPKRNPTIPQGRQAQLDHVQAAKEIHEDRGRVLAELDGKELANDPSNLRFTNAALNNNMKFKTVEEYIEWCEKNPDRVNYNGEKGKPLPEEVKKRMRAEYARAKKQYDAKVARAYYTSSKFAKDMAIAAKDVGLSMGLRQSFGFIFAEIWFATKEELDRAEGKAGVKLDGLLQSIGRGIKTGFLRAKEKFGHIFGKFGEGALAGIISSLTTTICNIFFTTAKNVVKIIRQAYASLVKAAEVLFINPDNYEMGDRMKAVTQIIATGSSIVVGVLASEAVHDVLITTPIMTIPGGSELRNVIESFCGAFVTGLVSCGFLYWMDRSPLMNALVTKLNESRTLETMINQYKRQAEYFEKYAAELEKIDIDLFLKEITCFEIATDRITKLEGKELNRSLLDCYDYYGIEKPWNGVLDLSDKNGFLHFKASTP